MQWSYNIKYPKPGELDIQTQRHPEPHLDDQEELLCSRKQACSTRCLQLFPAAWFFHTSVKHMLSTKVEYTRHFKTVLGRHDTWSEYIQSNQACIGVDGIFCNFFIKINYFALFDDILTLLTRESLLHVLQSPISLSLKSPHFPFMSAIPWWHFREWIYCFHLLFKMGNPMQSTEA